MNPSGSGWINKFGFLVSGDTVSFKDFTVLYDTLKKNRVRIWNQYRDSGLYNA